MKKVFSTLLTLGLLVIGGSVYAGSDAQCSVKYPETIYDSSTETCICPTDKPLSWNKFTNCGFMNGAVRVNVKQNTTEVKKTTENKKTVSTSVKQESKFTIKLKDKKCKKQDSNFYYDSGSKKCISNNQSTQKKIEQISTTGVAIVNINRLGNGESYTLGKPTIISYQIINNGTKKITLDKFYYRDNLSTYYRNTEINPGDADNVDKINYINNSIKTNCQPKQLLNPGEHCQIDYLVNYTISCLDDVCSHKNNSVQIKIGLIISLINGESFYNDQIITFNPFKQNGYRDQYSNNIIGTTINMPTIIMEKNSESEITGTLSNFANSPLNYQSWFVGESSNGRIFIDNGLEITPSSTNINCGLNDIIGSLIQIDPISSCQISYKVRATKSGIYLVKQYLWPKSNIEDILADNVTTRKVLVQ